MNRELRHKPAGVLFYLVFAMNILGSDSGRKFIDNLPTHANEAALYQVTAAALGTVAILFTSDTIGFVFSSFYVFWWNRLRFGRRPSGSGFSVEWRKLSYDFRDNLIALYGKTPRTAEEKHSRFESNWQTYDGDVFVSLFWQRAPTPLVEWATRRFTAFFAGVSAILGVSVALFLSTFVIARSSMGWSWMNSVLSVGVCLLAGIIWLNGRFARNQALQMIDVWLAGLLNPNVKRIMLKSKDLAADNAPIMRVEPKTTRVARERRDRASIEKRGRDRKARH